MKAMVLAAGEGRRLRPLTLTLPKPMVPIVGRPLLERTLTWLAGQGVSEAAINLYHRPQSIPDFFGNHFAGIRLHYFFEDVLRGTAGGLKAAGRLFRDEPFFVIYGDNFIHADLRRLADFHTAHKAIASIALFHHPNPTAAGIVGLETDGRVNRFVEKPSPDKVFSDLANAGIYVLDPSILDLIPDFLPCDFGRDIFPSLLQHEGRLFGTLLEGYLQDTGTPDSYRQANWDMLAGKTGEHYENPALWVADTAHIGNNVSFEGKNVIGEGVVIGSDVRLTDCIVWEGARIAAGTHLTQVIVGSHVIIDDECQITAGSLLAKEDRLRI